MKKYFVEFIRTFFIALIIALIVYNNADKMAVFAIGGILIVIVFAGGIFGGNYNPAITQP